MVAFIMFQSGAFELVDDLHFIASSATRSSVRDIIFAHFERNNQAFDDSIVTSLVEELCVSNPLSTALSSGGPLSSSFRRHQFCGIIGTP